MDKAEPHSQWIELAPPAEGDTGSEFLKEERLHNVRHPQLGVYRAPAGPTPRPAFVICPGGGYQHLSLIKEGQEVAHWLNSLGIDAFVLKYRLHEFGYPAPLRDVTKALRFLRKTAPQRNLDPARIGVLGFSAGAHVAGMAITRHDATDALPDDPQETVSARPDFGVLAYPVATLRDPHAHAGSRRNLLGDNPDPALLDHLSLENNIHATTPPIFLMHTAEDTAVPVQNSLQLAAAMARHQRPFALHVFPGGPHGIGMRKGHGAASNWPTLLAQWLAEMGIVEIQQADREHGSSPSC